MPLVMVRMTGLAQSGPKHLLADLSHLPLVFGQIAGTLVRPLVRPLLGLCLHEKLTMILGDLDRQSMPHSSLTVSGLEMPESFPDGNMGLVLL